MFRLCYSRSLLGIAVNIFQYGVLIIFTLFLDDCYYYTFAFGVMCPLHMSMFSLHLHDIPSCTRVLLAYVFNWCHQRASILGVWGGHDLHIFGMGLTGGRGRIVKYYYSLSCTGRMFESGDF